MGEGKYLRRGLATEDVFARARYAYVTEHASGPVPHETKSSIPVEAAKRVFAGNKRAKMWQRADGTYGFVVGDHWGWVGYQLLV